MQQVQNKQQQLNHQFIPPKALKVVNSKVSHGDYQQKQRQQQDQMGRRHSYGFENLNSPLPLLFVKNIDYQMQSQQQLINFNEILINNSHEQQYLSQIDQIFLDSMS